MQLSTNFTTIFLAKNPGARGAWVRRHLLPAGSGRSRGARALGTGEVYCLQGCGRARGTRAPGSGDVYRLQGCGRARAPARLGAGCRVGRRWTCAPATERLTSKPHRSTITRFTCRFIHRTMLAGCIWVSFPSERTAMDNRIGAVVARERKALGLTQEELARRLGITKAAVSKWELGQSMPDAALHQALRRNSRSVSTSSLIGEPTSPMPKSRRAREPPARSSLPMRLKGRRTFECAHASIVRAGNCSFAWRQSC